jgi:hypothetical protein
MPTHLRRTFSPEDADTIEKVFSCLRALNVKVSSFSLRAFQKVESVGVSIVE